VPDIYRSQIPTKATAAVRGRRRVLFAVIAVGVGLGVALAMIEVLFRFDPHLIPENYRQTLVGGGTELVTPGLLERTPIDAVPLPYGFNHERRMTGSTPRDLELIGMVSVADNPDRGQYPELNYRVDRFGFFNPTEMSKADLVLVGDSFVVAAGMLDPPGLQAQLAATTGLEVFNLAVPAIGPKREQWLLEEIGLALDPKTVIWFFFGGNDLDDAARLERHRRSGIQNHAELYKEKTPGLLSMAFLGASVDSVFRTDPPSRYLPGLVWTGHDTDKPIWFLPDHLRRLVRPCAQLRESVGWQATRAVLTDVAEKLRTRGIGFVVVYVPSKPQVFLPFVTGQDDLIHRMASYHRPLPMEPNAFVRLALKHRAVLENLLNAYCRRQEITFISLTPRLVELAGSGTLGYLAADTHWNEHGQAAALPVLKAHLGGEPKNDGQ